MGVHSIDTQRYLLGETRPLEVFVIDCFPDGVVNTKEPTPDGTEGLWAWRVLEAAYRSAHTGQASTSSKTS
jgi:hypothetical protein